MNLKETLSAKAGYIYNAILLILFLFGLAACRQKPSVQITADYLLEHRLCTDHDSALIKQITDTILSNSKWRDKVRINKPYDPECVNIYLFNGQAAFFRSDEQASQLSDNCYYAGYGIMFLDDAYFQSFLAAHHMDPGAQESLMYWIIGHELGHLICGHLSGHFSQRSLDKFVSNSTISNKEELQADSFYVN
ncbi:MAG TPA: hypothetical protein VGM63_24695, partial [Mucilaginibacter sp.]